MAEKDTTTASKSAPPEAPTVQTPRRSTVFVACKMPNGLELRLFKQDEIDEQTPVGSRRVTVSRENVEAGRVRLHGSVAPFGVHPEHPVSGGYSLTQVDAEWWAEWCRQNKDSDLLKNRIVFAHDSQEKSASQAREQAKEGVRSGLEPINPKKPPIVGIATAAA